MDVIIPPLILLIFQVVGNRLMPFEFSWKQDNSLPGLVEKARLLRLELFNGEKIDETSCADINLISLREKNFSEIFQHVWYPRLEKHYFLSPKKKIILPSLIRIGFRLTFYTDNSQDMKNMSKISSTLFNCFKQNRFLYWDFSDRLQLDDDLNVWFIVKYDSKSGYYDPDTRTEIFMEEVVLESMGKVS